MLLMLKWNGELDAILN